MAARFTYSRWDGTQRGFDLDADGLFDELTDDLLYHGDVNSALRRMMQEGMRDRNSILRMHEVMAAVLEWIPAWEGDPESSERFRKYLRIGLILGTKAMYDRCTGVEIFRDERKGESPSDHVPVVAAFK